MTGQACVLFLTQPHIDFRLASSMSSTRFARFGYLLARALVWDRPGPEPRELESW